MSNAKDGIVEGEIRTVEISEYEIGLLVDAGGRLSEIDFIMNRPVKNPQNNPIQYVLDNINRIYLRWENADAGSS